MHIDFVRILVVYLINVTLATSLPVDYGGWGSWGEWSKCSVTCGYGSVHRNKNWIFKNGQVSNYTYSMIVECWTEVPCPVNGGWTMWTAWSDCTKMCGSGTTTRTRLCMAPEPSENGRPCDGAGRDEVPCNNFDCPVLPYNFDMSLCNETTFICKSRLQCIPDAFHCDKILQCHDGSDEIPGDCRKFNSLNSGGCQRNNLLNILMILVIIVAIRITTNHPV